ncbi:40S ribosomal protein S5-1 [Hordeum vulgare]|nr:40S ribosomal protein S5-1 [Hordeum vulgare]
MQSPKAPKDKIFEKVINPYLAGVLQHPQSIEMREGMLHIRDVEGPKKTGSVEARLEAMEQQVFKCQGMVERGLNANHMMITEFTNKHKIDANDIGKHLSRLYDRIDHLQAQIYDLQNQNSPKDKIFEKVINPYLAGVLQHPQSIEMREGMLHIRDVEGPRTGSVEARLEAMEQQVFKCQGMVECGLNANHMMITEFTNKHKIDANDIGKHLSRLYDRIDHSKPRSMTCGTKTVSMSTDLNQYGWLQI